VNDSAQARSNGRFTRSCHQRGDHALARRNNRIPHPDQENTMLNELRNQRLALVIEVDRARQWRSSRPLDQIKKGLENKLVALDKAIKAEVEKQP
jgi:hypothetical protein